MPLMDTLCPEDVTARQTNGDFDFITTGTAFRVWSVANGAGSVVGRELSRVWNLEAREVLVPAGAVEEGDETVHFVDLWSRREMRVTNGVVFGKCSRWV